jgi:hypothetical protein
MVDRIRLLIVIIPCYVAAGYLAFSYIPYLEQQANSNIQYSLALDVDSTTYKAGDGRLTFSLNNQGSTSYLYIYGLSLATNINQAKVFVSNFYSQGGSSIPATDISVEPETIPLAPISESAETIKLTIQNDNGLGNFQGWFMLLVGNEIIAVPMTASTDPLYQIALLWVTVGALISIGTWELASFLDANRVEELLKDKPNNVRLNTRKSKHQAHLGSFLNAIQFTFVNVFTIIFGIAAFYLALLSNPQVMELQTISDLNRLSLIGLGLGIGSLSGFINKP